MIYYNFAHRGAFEYDKFILNILQYHNASVQLEEKLRKARVIHEDDHVEGQIGIGSLVAVEEIEDGEVVDDFTLTICGDGEEDPNNNVISYQSPIGSGLMGHSVGETVQIEVPMGELVLHIVNVTRGE